MDDLGFVKTVDCLGESIVVTVADAADRTLNAGPCEALGVSDGDVWGGFNPFVATRSFSADNRKRSNALVQQQGEPGCAFHQCIDC